MDVDRATCETSVVVAALYVYVQQLRLGLMRTVQTQGRDRIRSDPVLPNPGKDLEMLEFAPVN